MSARAEIKGRVSMDGSGVAVGLARAQQGGQAFREKMLGVGKAIAGAFAVRAIANFAREVVDLGSKISDMAYMTGLSTDQFQALGVAARRAGASEEQLTNALTKLKAAQGEVIGGNKTMIEAFGKLGISAEQVVRMDLPDLFKAVADGLTQSNNSAMQFNATGEILGMRNAPRLTEALNQLSREGFGSLIESGKQSGEIWEEDVIKKMDEVSDRLGKLKRVFQGFFADIMTWALDAVDALRGFWEAASAGGLRAGIREMMTGERAAQRAEKRETPDYGKLERDARAQAYAERKAKEAEDAKAKDEKRGKADVKRATGGFEAVDSLRAIGAGGAGGPLGDLQQAARDTNNLLTTQNDLLRQQLAKTDTQTRSIRDIGLG